MVSEYLPLYGERGASLRDSTKQVNFDHVLA